MTRDKPLEILVTADRRHYWIRISKDDFQEVEAVSGLGQHARIRREFLGMSQQAVASIMKNDFDIPWHQTVVAKVEAGERQVKLNEALALSHLYAMALEDLLTGSDLEGNARLVSNEVHMEGTVGSAAQNVSTDPGAERFVDEILQDVEEEMFTRQNDGTTSGGQKKQASGTEMRSAKTGRFGKIGKKVNRGVDQETT